MRSPSSSSRASRAAASAPRETVPASCSARAGWRRSDCRQRERGEGHAAQRLGDRVVQLPGQAGAFGGGGGALRRADHLDGEVQVALQGGGRGRRADPGEHAGHRERDDERGHVRRRSLARSTAAAAVNPSAACAAHSGSARMPSSAPASAADAGHVAEERHPAPAQHAAPRRRARGPRRAPATGGGSPAGPARQDAHLRDGAGGDGRDARRRSATSPRRAAAPRPRRWTRSRPGPSSTARAMAAGAAGRRVHQRSCRSSTKNGTRWAACRSPRPGRCGAPAARGRARAGRPRTASTRRPGRSARPAPSPPVPSSRTP